MLKFVIMEINFRTKEESNKIQREKFLNLSPSQRIYSFLSHVYLFNSSRVSSISSSEKNNSKNFIINL